MASKKSAANDPLTRVRKIISEGLQIGRGAHFSIVLKDVSTIEGDPTRLTRWAEICREEIDKAW